MGQRKEDQGRPDTQAKVLAYIYKFYTRFHDFQNNTHAFDDHSFHSNEISRNISNLFVR